eukprot:gene6724-3395_t
MVIRTVSLSWGTLNPNHPLNEIWLTCFQDPAPTNLRQLKTEAAQHKSSGAVSSSAWAALWTKQIKKKSKVWQDGFIVRNSASGTCVLYDDAGKHLSSNRLVPANVLDDDEGDPLDLWEGFLVTLDAPCQLTDVPGLGDSSTNASSDTLSRLEKTQEAAKSKVSAESTSEALPKWRAMQACTTVARRGGKTLAMLPSKSSVPEQASALHCTSSIAAGVGGSRTIFGDSNKAFAVPAGKSICRNVPKPRNSMEDGSFKPPIGSVNHSAQTAMHRSDQHKGCFGDQGSMSFQQHQRGQQRQQQGRYHDHSYVSSELQQQKQQQLQHQATETTRPREAPKRDYRAILDEDDEWGNLPDSLDFSPAPPQDWSKTQRKDAIQPHPQSFRKGEPATESEELGMSAWGYNDECLTNQPTSTEEDLFCLFSGTKPVPPAAFSLFSDKIIEHPAHFNPAAVHNHPRASNNWNSATVYPTLLSEPGNKGVAQYLTEAMQLPRVDNLTSRGSDDLLAPVAKPEVRKWGSASRGPVFNPPIATNKAKEPGSFTWGSKKGPAWVKQQESLHPVSCLDSSGGPQAAMPTTNQKPRFRCPLPVSHSSEVARPAPNMASLNHQQASKHVQPTPALAGLLFPDMAAVTANCGIDSMPGTDQPLSYRLATMTAEPEAIPAYASCLNAMLLEEINLRIAEASEVFKASARQMSSKSATRAQPLPLDKVASELEKTCVERRAPYFASCQLTMWKEWKNGPEKGRGGRGRHGKGRGRNDDDEGDDEWASESSCRGSNEASTKTVKYYMTVHAARTRYKNFRQGDMWIIGSHPMLLGTGCGNIQTGEQRRSMHWVAMCSSLWHGPNKEGKFEVGRSQSVYALRGPDVQSDVQTLEIMKEMQLAQVSPVIRWLVSYCELGLSLQTHLQQLPPNSAGGSAAQPAHNFKVPRVGAARPDLAADSAAGTAGDSAAVSSAAVTSPPECMDVDEGVLAAKVKGKRGAKRSSKDAAPVYPSQAEVCAAVNATREQFSLNEHQLGVLNHVASWFQFKAADSGDEARAGGLGAVSQGPVPAEHGVGPHGVHGQYMREGVDDCSSSVQPPVCLIHGPFGSGKSTLLVAIISFIAHMVSLLPPSDATACRILVAAHTNTAVDRMLLGLKESGFSTFLRVGSVQRIARPILQHSVHSAEEGSSKDTISQLKEMLGSASSISDVAMIKSEIVAVQAGAERQRRKQLQSVPVVGATCCALLRPLMQGMRFAFVVVDECHPDLSAVPNRCFYGGCLVDGCSPSDRPPLLPPLPALCFCNVDGQSKFDPRTRSTSNKSEAVLVARLVQCMIAKGVQPQQIGVICFYKAQVSAIQRELSSLLSSSSSIAPSSKPPDAAVGGDTERSNMQLAGQHQPPAGWSRPDTRHHLASQQQPPAGWSAPDTRHQLAGQHQSPAGWSRSDTGHQLAGQHQPPPEWSAQDTRHQLAGPQQPAGEQSRGLASGADEGSTAAENSPMEQQQNKDSLDSVQVATVDSFQGAEKEVIILSTTITVPGDFVADEKRLNVALTRARRHLFVLGSAHALERTSNVFDSIIKISQHQPLSYFHGSAPLLRVMSRPSDPIIG